MGNDMHEINDEMHEINDEMHEINDEMREINVEQKGIENKGVDPIFYLNSSSRKKTMSAEELWSFYENSLNKKKVRARMMKGFFTTLAIVGAIVVGFESFDHAVTAKINIEKTYDKFEDVSSSYKIWDIGDGTVSYGILERQFTDDGESFVKNISVSRDEFIDSLDYRFDSVENVSDVERIYFCNRVYGPVITEEIFGIKDVCFSDMVSIWNGDYIDYSSKKGKSM